MRKEGGKMKRVLCFTALIAMSVVIAVSPLAAAANLLKNPGFETGGDSDQDAAEWTESGAGQRESWANHSDGWGFALETWGDSAGTGEVYQEIPVKGSAKYVFSLWTLTDFDGYAGEFYLKLVWYKGDTILKEDRETILLANKGGAWDKKTISAASPATADKVRVVIGSLGVSSTGKFDDLEFGLQ